MVGWRENFGETNIPRFRKGFPQGPNPIKRRASFFLNALLLLRPEYPLCDLPIRSRRLFMLDIDPDGTDIGERGSDEVVAVTDADVENDISQPPIRPSRGRCFDFKSLRGCDARLANQSPYQGASGKTLQRPCRAFIAFGMMLILGRRKGFDERPRVRL